MNIKITAPIHQSDAPAGMEYLVIGPNCWARGTNLSKALEQAESMRPDYCDGTFVSFKIPAGRTLHIDDNGAWGFEPQTKGEMDSAATSRKTIAVTDNATRTWTKAWKVSLRGQHK